LTVGPNSSMPSSTGTTPGHMLTPSLAGSLSNMSISDKGMSASSSANVSFCEELYSSIGSWKVSMDIYVSYNI
jgi:hypothetical protein